MKSFGKIVCYETVEEMPQERWHKFNKFLIADANIGGTLEQFDKLMHKLDTFLKARKFEEAVQQRVNIHNSMYNAIIGLDYNSMSFACLVKEVDGKIVDINTDEDAKRIGEKLAKTLTHHDVAEYVIEVKKKILSYLGYTFQTDTDQALA